MESGVRKGVRKETVGKEVKDREADTVKERDRDRRGRKQTVNPPVVGGTVHPGSLALLGDGFSFRSGQGQAEPAPRCLGRTELSEASCWPGSWW